MPESLEVMEKIEQRLENLHIEKEKDIVQNELDEPKKEEPKQMLCNAKEHDTKVSFAKNDFQLLDYVYKNDNCVCLKFLRAFKNVNFLVQTFGLPRKFL